MDATRNIRIMGIVNLTDDSFFEGSRSLGKGIDAILEKIGKMTEDGATMVDIGACSSRPGAFAIGAEKEWERLGKVLPKIRKAFPDIAISIDTEWSEVVRRCYDSIGSIIANDVSGLSDPDMMHTVISLKIPYVYTFTGDTDMDGYFRNFSIDARKEGLENWIIDPGFGFGKSLKENWRTLRAMGVLRLFRKPILVGLSRKSMLYAPLGITPENALSATVAVNVLALQRGADILRVHDIAQAKEAISIYRMSEGEFLVKDS